MGRNSKLDDATLEKILANLALGLSERDACDLAGITQTTLQNWKRRARAAAEILPGDWPKLGFEEMRACAEELGVKLTAIRGTGRSGRLTRDDLVRVLQERAQRFIVFLAKLKAAEATHKAAILSVLDDLVQGRVRIKRTRTTQKIRYVEQANGTMVPQPYGDAIVTTEILELPPDRMVATKILEMRWPEEFGGRRKGRGAGAGEDPSAAAKEVHEAVQRMLSTVPAPAGLLPESGEAEEGASE